MFLRRLAVLSEVKLEDDFDTSCDACVVSLLKFAEVRVNKIKGRGKQLSKGQKFSSMLHLVEWVCVSVTVLWYLLLKSKAHCLFCSPSQFSVLILGKADSPECSQRQHIGY